MKRILIAILICSFLINLMPADVRVKAATDGFMIDETGLYPNMDSTYQDGYSPKISGGKAMLVLPLLSQGYDYIQGNQITASVKYGSVTDTPFQIKQYQKKVTEDSYALTEKVIRSAYLVEFDLELKNDRTNGVYPVTIAVQYNVFQINEDGGASLVTKEQDFTVYVVIQDGKDSGGNPDVPENSPVIRLENCSIDPQAIYPGDTFSIRSDIKNISSTASVKNMKITFDNAEGVLMPSNHTGTVYVDHLDAGGTTTITMDFKAADIITGTQQKINLSITYEDDRGTGHSETDNISIAILKRQEDYSGPISNVLEIDTQHTYSGMEHMYQSGYVPSVAKDRASIIMPLVFRGEGEIKGNEITASIGFQDLTGKALKVKSYEKNFKLSSMDSKEGDKISGFFLKFDLELQKDRINGVYPVTVNLTFEVGNEVKSQSFTVYVVITDGKDADDGTEEIPVEFTPRIIITDCKINPSECNPNDVATFEVTIQNSGSTEDIRDIILTYTSDNGDLLPVQYNNSIYIDKLRAGKSKLITFQMKVAPEISSTNQKIILSFDGEDDNAASVSGSQSLYLSVNQPFDIQLDKPQLAAQVKSGKSEEIILPIFNTGSTKVKNITCTLEMEGVIPSGSAFIGEIEPGASSEATLNMVIANKRTTNPDIAEDDKYGLVKGIITVHYEDTQGNAYSQSMDVMTTIKPPANETKEPQGISSQWWISIILGMIIIQLIAMGILFYRKKRNI